MDSASNDKLNYLANWHDFPKDGGNGKTYKQSSIRIPPATPRVIAVGGGKGGVGKTVVSTLLGICLANMNKKTVILDADFSGANLHTCLDTFDSKITFKNFLSQGTRDINRILLKTDFKNLHIVSGSPGVLGIGNFSYWQKKKIIRNLRKLQADYVILDLAAGIGYNELDLFLAADDGIIICHADPMSIQDAYGFARASLLRKLQRTFHHWPEFLSILNECGNLDQGRQIRSLESVLDSLPDLDHTWRHLIDGMVHSFRPKLVLNMSRDDDDQRQVQALRLTLKNMLGVVTDIWGSIRFDPAVRAALRQMRPDLLLTPSGQASEDIVRLVSRNIIAREVMGREMNSDRDQHNYDTEYMDSDVEGVRICSYQCVAWNCCNKRQGGLPCAKVSLPGKCVAA